MCGRFSLSLSAADVKKLFDIDICDNAVQSYIKNWNIAPGMDSPVFFSDDKQTPSLTMMKWGIARNAFSFTSSPAPQSDSITINTRKENLIEKTYYRRFFETRCIIPASGYYEWMKQGKSSIPFYIKQSDEACLFFAGIWHNSDTENRKAYSIITTEALPGLSRIHDRMPLILAKNDAALWIKEKDLKPADMAEMVLAKNINLEYYSVSMFVNSTANNSERCIEETFYSEQPDLF